MTITQSSTRFVAVAAGIVLALSLVLVGTPANAAGLSDSQVQSILNLLSSFGADAATINNVNAALHGQATGGTTGGSTGGACPALSRDLQQGSTGSDVMALQVFLNGSADTMVSASGAGSPGNETTTFGPATKAAVIKFQTKYNVTPIAGYVGAKTRAQIAAVCGGTGGNTGGGTGGTAGTITVSAAAQPANTLAVAGAQRVPYTTFTLTNNSGAAVTVNSVTVQRTGLGVDANFAGIVLLDSNGLQIGNSKTLNSNHQASIGDSGFTLQPGQSMTYTVAGNMAASGTAQNGQVVSLQVVAVNTSAAVSGSLPITGASQTINTTLTLGSVSTSTSAFDPGAAQTKNIGDTGIKFSGLKFTAGSTEDLKLYSIRWRQVGSVTSSDLANVVTIVNGTSYPATVDSTGKYYTTIFPGGISIAKGDSIDVYVQGDVVGSNASSRTVDFDIDKVTDVYFVGQLYGYGIAPSGTFTPWYNGYVVTLSGASVTTIGKDSTGVNAAQNIAVNVSNQPLGGYTIDLKGEPISVGSTVVTFATTTASTGLLTNVSIVNENGAVVAGPVDTTWVSGVMTATFTDTITYPLGKHTYSIRGKVPSGAGNGATIAATTNPASGWTSMTGQTTGNSVTLTNGSFTMNTMTVKAGSLAIAVSSTPAAQNIVSGSQSFTFSNIQLDATQSGEDIRLNAIALSENGSLNATGGAANKLSSCQLWDGATALNGGSNVVNPTATATSSAVTANFTFDNSLVVPKGTVKTLSVRCNLSSSVDTSSTFSWGISTAQIAALSATGVSSGATITASGSQNFGQLMTVASAGSVVASTDSSSPSYTLAAANQTGVTLGVYKLRATNEDVNLTRIGLKLTNTASSSASDLTNVYLYKGATLIGTAQFVGSNTNATSTLSSPLTLTRDTDTVITVKGDIANIGTSQPGTEGHLVAVDIDTNGTNTQGTGAQSGSTVNASGSTAVAGVRTFKSYPTVAKDTLPSNTLNNGSQALLRFKVTANANGDIGIARFVLQIATTTATVTGIDIFAFTDSTYSTPVTGLSSDGGMEATDIPGTAWVTSATDLEVDATTSGGASTTVQVPAGLTRYFEVRGTVSGAASGASIQTTLQGDSAYPSLSGFMTTFNGVNADTNDDFIWSPNSTTTSTTDANDWTNGFGVSGLPSAGISDTISK